MLQPCRKSTMIKTFWYLMFLFWSWWWTWIVSGYWCTLNPVFQRHATRFCFPECQIISLKMTTCKCFIADLAHITRRTISHRSLFTPLLNVNMPYKDRFEVLHLTWAQTPPTCRSGPMSPTLYVTEVAKTQTFMCCISPLSLPHWPLVCVYIQH